MLEKKLYEMFVVAFPRLFYPIVSKLGVQSNWVYFRGTLDLVRCDVPKTLNNNLFMVMRVEF